MKKLIKISALMLALVMSASLMLSCTDSSNGENPSDSSKPGDQNNGITGVNPDGDPNSPDIGFDIGELAAPFALEKITEEGTVNIKEFRGKVVILNFWGTWCGPCKLELPAFDQFASERADDVVVIAIHSSLESANAPSYITENYSGSKIIFAYDVPLDGITDIYYDALGGEGFYPYTVVLDKDGIITYKQSGAMSYEQLETQVDAALAK